MTYISAGLFFVTYDSLKSILRQRFPIEYEPFIHMGSASLAEMVGKKNN